MKIILFGPPGSGKGTQSYFITKKYGIPHISTGDMLRQVIQSDNKIGNIIKKNIDNGILVDDKIIINLIKKRIKKNDCLLGYVLDGFPRTLLQAIEMKKENIIINYIIEFQISDELIYERILGRRIHIKSGRTYHIKFQPPKIPGKDDITNEKLTIRSDDTYKIVKKRLLEYKKIKHTVIKYYKNTIIQNKMKYYLIHAEQNTKKINEQLINIFTSK